MSIARARTIVGSLYALMRNALGLNVATQLETQELSCTVAPDRRLVVLGHDPIAGFARDHGTVADEAAMLALHTLDSTTLLAAPTFVAPGDSCLRTDDPGWRWHCISGHGQALSDWERRPLAGALTLASLTEVVAALAGKQAASANLDTLAGVASSAAGRNLLTVATPSGPKLVQVNADGSISLVVATSGGGGSAMECARISRSESVAMNTGTNPIPWQSATAYSGSGLWSADQPTRLVASTAGLWRAMVWLRLSNVYAVLFRVNGVREPYAWRAVSLPGETNLWSADFTFSTGDYAEVCTYCTSSGTVLYNADNSPFCTWQRIG